MSFKVKDFYYHKAKKENYLARSVYKLEEIQKRHNVLKKGLKVIDLGYYPGSWAQYTSSIVGPQGLVVGVDIQPVNKQLSSYPNITALQKDIDEIVSYEEFNLGDPFDVVLSDMAPKTSGIKIVDQERSLQLVEKVFNLLPCLLKVGGNVVTKIFEGGNTNELLKEQKKLFKEFYLLRPKGTRSTSKEFFAIGKSWLQKNK